VGGCEKDQEFLIDDQGGEGMGSNLRQRLVKFDARGAFTICQYREARQGIFP